MMSLCVCGRIKEKCINEDLLERVLTKFFLPENNIIRERNEKCVIYERVNSDDSIMIFFINEERPPYNMWDSTIINSEFEYTQLIAFNIKKEDASIDIYKDILNFFVRLKKEINSDILVTSDVHNDICLLMGREIIWSRELSFNYSRSIK